MPKSAERLMAGAFLAVVLAVFSHTRADPDLWGHVRFGADTVAARAITTTDPYSFTSDRPWINHEWLAEVVMYGAYAAGSDTGLVCLKLAVLAAMLGLVIASWPVTLPHRARRLLVGLVVIGTVPQANHVRPQLFSLLLFAVLLKLLVRPPAALASPWRRTAAIGVTFAAWANLHGGWIVGGAVLAVWGAGSAYAAREWRTRLAWAATLATAFLATAANPYGWHLWQFLRDTVGFGRPQITDWQPIYVMPPAFGALWLLVAGAAVVAIWRGARTRRLDLRSAAVACLLAFASFRVNRLLAFFAIAVAVLLADAFAAAPAPRSAAADVRAVPGRLTLASIVALVLAATITAGAAGVTYSNVGCVRIDPATAPEADAFAALANPAVHGRMLTWFDWGEYAIWHFSPRLTVSIDGRRETVYSDEAIRSQFDFYTDPAVRHAVVADLRPDVIWLPATLPLTADLEHDGWTPIFTGTRSTILARHAVGLLPASLAAASGRRCFPGP